MSFAHPALLWLLLLPLAAIAWMLRRPGLRVTLPGDHLRAGLAPAAAAVIPVLQAMPALMLAAAIALAAGPRATEMRGGERLMANIEIVLDESKSMTYQFANTNHSRYDAAAVALVRFTRRHVGDAFGLTLFSDEVVHWLPLTTDLGAIECAVPFLDPKKLGRFSNGTRMRKALLAARDHLAARGDGERMILLVTDGEPRDFTDPRPLASELAAADVAVFEVHVGKDAPPAIMQQLCEATGGFAFAAADEAALARVFARIEAMKPERFGSPAGQPTRSDGIVAALGLAFAGAWVCSLLGLRYTPW